MVERAHARWSASASSRNWACPGSLAMVEALGPGRTESEAGAWGTACHSVVEKALTSYKDVADFRGISYKDAAGFLGAKEKDAADFLGTTEKTEFFEFEVDEEMAECAQVFIDYVRRRINEYEKARPEGAARSTMLVEQEFDLFPIRPPIEAGGIGDVVLLFPAWAMIEVIDLKTGKGVTVEVGVNKQLRTYALGALLANRGEWIKICSTIVQPRKPHSDGAIRSETMLLPDLIDWTTDLRAAMDRSASAMRKFNPASTAWVEDFLSPGEHCTFCPAAGTCPALFSRALADAQTLFAEEGTIPPPPDPQTLPIEKLVAILDAADMLKNWLNAVSAHARRLVESGHPVAHGPHEYILVPKRGVRRWKLESEPDLVTALSQATGIPEGAFYLPPVLRSPAQAETLLSNKNRIADLWIQESSGTNLVRRDKTTKPALPSAMERILSIME